MGSLLRYLTTGEGSDLILICHGGFFCVHKTVIAANSPVLKKEISTSGLLACEAYMLKDMDLPVLGKILAFMYRGNIPESYRKSLSSNPQAHLPLHEKFPMTDKFLMSLNGQPATVESNKSAARATGAMTNRDKWALMLKAQGGLNIPYDETLCKDYAEVMFEVDIYVAAEKLEISALKDVAMKKIFAWSEVELQTGLP